MESSFQLGTIDVAILAAAMCSILVVGWFALRQAGQSASNYFTASRRMPWWLIGLSFVSTSVSSEQMVGTVGAAYQYGMGVANWEWFTLPTYAALLIFFVPLYLKNRISTVPQLLSNRFSPLCGDLYSWTMLLAYVFIFLPPVLYGGALAVNELTGWDFHRVLYGIGIIVALYTIKGGMRATMWTGAFECLLLLGGGLTLYFVSLSQIPGGWNAMQQAVPERFHLYHPPNDPQAPFAGLIAGACGVFLFYSAANQYMIQRVLTARTTWDGLMGIIFAGFINLVRPLITCFLGFIVYHWIFELHRASPLENLDQTFPFALKTFAPEWGLKGIVLAGFLAAVMSAASSLTNAISTLFSLDVYRRLINPSASDEKLVMIGRITGGTALAVSCLLAPFVRNFGGIFNFFQTGITYLATPFISVILVGIFWKRANAAGALAGILGGLVIVLCLAIGVHIEEIKINWLYVSLIAEILIVLLIVAVSLSTPPVQSATASSYVWSPGVLSHFDQGRQRPWYQNAGLWFGIYAACWFGIYAWFW